MGNNNQRPNISTLDDESKAVYLIAEANNKIKRGYWFEPKDLNREDAVELYSQAANIYRKLGKWKDAGDNYIKAAQFEDDESFAINYYINAAEVYVKYDNFLAIANYNIAIDNYNKLGLNNQSARCQEKIALIYENIGDYTSALNVYLEIIKYVNNYRHQIKTAELYRKLQDYKNAAEVYINLINHLPNCVRKFQENKYLFLAGICLLCVGDLVAVDRFLQTMSPSQEQIMLKDLVIAVENIDLVRFDQLVEDSLISLKEIADLLPLVRKQCENDSLL